MSKPAASSADKPSKKSRRSSRDAEDHSKPAKRAEVHSGKGRRMRQDDDGDGGEDAAEAMPRSTKSVLNSEEKSFPRGGASVLTPIERKQIQIQADRDALFEESGKKRPLPADVTSDDEQSDVAAENESLHKHKKKRKTRPSQGETEPVVKVDRIEGLSFKKLVPGSLVLGQVTSITSRDIAIALPNNLTGYVPLTSISRQLTARVEKLLEEADRNEDNDSELDEFEDVDLKRLFKEGQYLRAAVVSNDELQGAKHKKHIELSLDPRLTNAGLTKEDLIVNSTVQAGVASIEDGGLILDLGIDSVDAKGFISANELGAGVKHTDIGEGAVFLCLVTGLNGNGRVIKLSCDPARIGNVKKGGHALTNAPSVNTFLPGTAANIIVSDVAKNGIRGSIMGMLDVTADFIHSGGAQSKQGLEAKFKPGSKVQARVVFSYPKNESQKVGISVTEHLLSLSSSGLANKKGLSPLEQLPRSTMVEEAKVVKIDPRNGVYLDLGVPRVYGFAHISRLSDKKIDTLSEDIGPYKVDSIHKARVLGYSVVDGLFSVSLEESILAQPFLRMEDVLPGEVVDGTIQILPVKGDGVSGILLQLAEGIRGFVPVDHISDVRLKHPERKYRAGMKVKARVLSTNLEKKSIYLTLKKTLVGSETKPWTSYDVLEVGEQSPGSITKLTQSGAWVQFYGDVRAFLPVREMSEAYIKDPAEHFRVGQVVNVHIISIDREGKRVLVSCKDPSTFSKDREAKFRAIKVGQHVNGSIVELANDLVTLELDGGIQGHLQVHHLTDGSEKKNAAALSKMRAGMKLQNLVVLHKHEGSRTVALSNKPSISAAARDGKLITRLSQLKKGMKVDGFISNIIATGIFVEFGGNLTGLIPVSGMPNAMRQLQLQDFGQKAGQSISVTVWNIYTDDSRFTLTLRDDEPTAQIKDDKEAPRAPRELQHPVDNKLTTIEELTIGVQTLARVNAVKELQLNVSLADNVNGRIHITEMFKSFDDIDDPKKPLQSIKHNATLPITITGLHNAKTHKFLPFSHRQSVHPVYECSHRQSDTAVPDILSLLKLHEDEERLAFIIKYTDSHALASISPEIHGSIDVVDLASIETNYQQAFPLGSALKVKVSNIDVEKGKLNLIPAEARMPAERTFKEGSIYMGHVRRSHGEGIDVQLAKKVWGLVPLTELTDDYEQARIEKWAPRDAIRVKVLASNEAAGRFVLSARPSLTTRSLSAPEVKDRHVTGNDDLATCDVIRGFVQKISKQGILVRLGWNAIAHVPVHDLADEYIKDYTSVFKLQQLVTGKITKVDPEEGHHKMSLRKSVVNDANFLPELGFTDIEVGHVVDAVVVKVESYGVFIRVSRSRNIRGLCHVKELASTRVDDPSKLYSEGDLVKAKIIKLDRTKRHVNFSLKAVHFQGLQEVDEMIEAEQHEIDEDDDTTGVGLGNIVDADEEANVEPDSDEEMEDAGTENQGRHSVSTGGLKTSGFDWSGEQDGEDHDTSHLEAEQNLPKKKRQKAKIQVDMTGDLDAHGPQSVSDFERLLLGQPNSSSLWIQYMAFQLGLSEVEKAREIAERALKTIHMREEEEKMNIWIAWLNLENTYGSEELLESVFERACQMSDKKEVNMRLASIYIDSSKHKDAETLFERMRKNRDISSDPNYWLNYATFLMTTLNRADDGRAILQRATQSVPAHQHAHLISRFGALEYSSPHGDIERGRTVFEGLVDAHKNGHDLWDQYVAQEISLAHGERGNVENVRKLFERMVKMKMRPKRAKYVFKKWLTWEKGLLENGKGSDKMLMRVKALAEDWVENEGKGKELDV